LFSDQQDLIVQSFVSAISNSHLRIVGPQRVLDPIFDKVFPHLTKPFFKDLVLCRIIYPGSKLRTQSNLSRHFNKSVSAQTIYRSMDGLDDDFKKQAEDCMFQRAKKATQTGELS
jgi:hypothetical protein